MKKNNIGVLITIILLLLVFLPGAIYGTYMHYKGEAQGGNPNKEFFYEGKLYFYNGNNLLGTYRCETTTCGYATNSIANSYEFDAFNQDKAEIKMINNRFAFIEDGEKINFYDIKNATTIVNYAEVKNYSIGISGNYYLVKNTNGLWGMLKIDDNARAIIPFKYDYLGLLNKMDNNNQIDANKIIAHDSEGWKILNISNSVILKTTEEIVDYSNNLVVTKDNDLYKVYDYNNNEVMANYSLSNVKLLDTLAIATTNNNFYVVYNASTKNIVKTFAKVNDIEYSFKLENNALVIMNQDAIIETIALS